MGRGVPTGGVESRVRGLRIAAGLSQAALAERTGLTRQAINAIEAGRYVPNTAVALRLARVLGCAVEHLFAIPDEPRRVDAELIGEPPPVEPLRVQLARVGGRLLAHGLDGPAGLTMPADGFVRRPPVAGRADVELLADPQALDRTAVVVGCDPSLALIGAHLSRRYPSFRLLWLQSGSLAALRALARGEAHAAGSHLRDAATGEDNLPFVRRELAGRTVLVVTLSQWQQGLMVARGNPKGVREAADLLRPDVAVANREPGSGGRALLDRVVAEAGGAPERLRGYDQELPSHLAVAQAVASGGADAGPGIEAAARAYGLDFLPLQDERYDLVIPVEHLEAPPIQALLDVVTSPICRAEVESLGGYDSSRSGTVVARVPA
jgi:molybdate-binding protein/DNA-binding XRE family transcriptional regulator